MAWQADLNHSSVTISVKHMMVTTVRGTLAIKRVELDLDPEHPETSSVTAVLDAASVDTRNEQRDAHLRSADFLDVENHPEIVFRSTDIERLGDDRGLIHGELTLRGVTRPVTLDAEFGGVVPDMKGGRRASFSARGKVNREEFGLTWNVALEQGGWLVGKELTVEIELAVVESLAQAEQQAAAEAEMSEQDAATLSA